MSRTKFMGIFLVILGVISLVVGLVCLIGWMAVSRSDE